MRSLCSIAILISALLPACGGGDPEEEAVSAFFSALQQGDPAVIERASLAGFDGSVESWEILERGTESEGPFQLAELEAELQSDRNEVRARRESNLRFIGDNRDTYDNYTKTYAENPSAGFEGELAAFHERLQTDQSELAQLEVDAEQLASDITALKNAATMSVTTPVDKNFEGQIRVKPLQVKINDGAADKTYTVVLHRYELVDTRQERAPTARWIVAEIQPNS